MKYNYYEVMTADILEYIRDNYSAEEIAEKMQDKAEWEQELHEDLWICDSVTGNASGSYYCNTFLAEEAIAHNWDLLREALSEFGCDGINPIKKGAEWCDVTIRCYLLGECLCNVLDNLEAAAESEDAE